MARLDSRMDRVGIFKELEAERIRQDAKFGNQTQNLDVDPTESQEFRLFKEKAARRRCQDDFKNGMGSWQVILQEELMEACAAPDEQSRRTELVQLAAVCVAWIENIDRRAAAEPIDKGCST